MKVSKGEIWLANLNPIKQTNEMGKTRPVVVIQTDLLNHNGYPTTIILPLTTDLIDDAWPLRLRIPKRDHLGKDSDIVLTQIRAIDNARFMQKLGALEANEWQSLKILFEEIVF